MTLQDIKDLDFYKCSLQDINKADKVLANYLRKLINTNSIQYNEVKKLHVLVSRAKSGMTPAGYMIGRNIDLERKPNSQSAL